MFVAIVVLSLVGIRVGGRLRRRESARSQRGGTALVAVCCLVPFAAYYGPSLYTRVTLGRFPLGCYPYGVIREGMTRDEVQTRLGTPNDRYECNEEERWLYSIDALGADYFCVAFRADGRVKRTCGN